MIIRKVIECDKDEFIAMSKVFYASEAVLHDVDESYHEAAFNELMHSDTYLDCYFFERENVILGYALLNKTYSREAGGIVIWVEELYVKLEYQGQGIGNEFFDWIELNIPAARYRLETEPENIRAKALYQRRGYEVLPYIQMVKDNFES